MIKKYTYPISLTLSLIILVFVSFLFIRQYLSIKNRGDFQIRHSHEFTPNNKLLQSWMTFEYLNRSFNLPTDYLKNELHISDSKYPHSTIASTANSLGITKEECLILIKNSILKFSTSTNASKN